MSVKRTKVPLDALNAALEADDVSVSSAYSLQSIAASLIIITSIMEENHSDDKKPEAWTDK